MPVYLGGIIKRSLSSDDERMQIQGIDLDFTSVS